MLQARFITRYKRARAVFIIAVCGPAARLHSLRTLRTKSGGLHQSVDFPTDEKENAMSQYQIAVLVGSLRKDSFNRQLATAIAKLAPSEFTFKQVEIGDLPLYNQDDDGSPAESVKRLKAEITAAQGLLFVTPEYNRSIPGVLKNAIDHASRPYGQSVWAGKPECWAPPSVPSARRWRSSICATSSPTSTFPRWASPKPSSMPRTDCSMAAAISGPTARSFCKPG